MIGLSISDDAVRFIKLGRHKIHAFDEVPLSPGAINHGVINNPESLSSALRLLKDKFGLKAVNATFPHRRGYIFNTTIEKKKDVPVEELVERAVEENVHMPLSSVYFDYQIVGENPDQAEVVVAVQPLSVARSYEREFRKVGIKPIFHPEPQAVAKAVVYSEDDRPHLVVHIGDQADLYVVERNVVRHSCSTSFENLKKDINKVKMFWNTGLDNKGIQNRKIEKVIAVGRKSHNASFDGELADVWRNISFKPVSQMPFHISLAYAAAIGAAISEKKSPEWKKVLNKIGYF